MSTQIQVNTMVNGEATEFRCEPHQNLLYCLREILGLTGTKEGCSDGNCGSCSVLLDDRLVNSCLVLGAEADGREILTVEGLESWEGLHPLQEAFIEHDALQCGFCTPGMLIAAKALLDRNLEPTEKEIREWMAGNLCRCTGYDKIVRAINHAGESLRSHEES